MFAAPPAVDAAVQDAIAAAMPMLGSDTVRTTFRWTEVFGDRDFYIASKPCGIERVRLTHAAMLNGPIRFGWNGAARVVYWRRD
jgi:hypothetical protein